MDIEHMLVWIAFCTPIVSGKITYSYYKITYGDTAPLNTQCLLEDMRNQLSVGVQVTDEDKTCEVQPYTWYLKGKPFETGYTFFENFEFTNVYDRKETKSYLVEVMKPFPIESRHVTDLLVNNNTLFFVAVYLPSSREIMTEMKIFNPPSMLRYSEIEIMYRHSTTYLIEVNFDDVFVMEIDISARKAIAAVKPYKNAARSSSWINRGDTFVYVGTGPPILRWIKYSKKL